MSAKLRIARRAATPHRDGTKTGPTPEQAPVRRRVLTLPGSPGRRELGVFAAVYALYDAGRWAFAGQLPLARAHSHWVIHLERSLHVAVEGSVQRALRWGVASFLLSSIYLAAQLAVLPGALAWLYHRSPDIYRRLRNTVVTTWLIATPVFALYPVAPPRLAGVGLTDTVSHQAAVALTGHSTMFYNPYAAVPSLHAGLAFAIGIAAATALRGRWARALALGWGPLVTVAVVATGNHYLFDVAAGLFTTGLAYTAVRLADRAPLGGSRVKPPQATRRSCRPAPSSPPRLIGTTRQRRRDQSSIDPRNPCLEGGTR